MRFVDPLVRRILRASASHERRYAKKRENIARIEHILYDMDIIDSKSSALLTHVSIMLAVVAVLKALLPGGVWQILLTCELVGFSTVALLLLRCVDVMGPPLRDPPDDLASAGELYYEEILFRRAIYQSMLRIVFYLTLMLIAVVAGKGAAGLL